MAGSFQLTSQLELKITLATAAALPWRKLSGCPSAPAQDLLDAAELGLGGTLVAAIEAKRGTPTPPPNAARHLPSTMTSVDPQLQALTADGPAAQLPAIATIRRRSRRRRRSSRGSR